MRRTRGILRLQSYVQTLLIILGVPFWIISLGCVYLGWAVATKQIIPDIEVTLALVIASVLITGSTFAYNDYADRDLDRTNIRKKGSLLMRGRMAPPTVLGLALGLAFLGIVLSFFINLEFTVLMGGCVVLSILYSNPHVKLKGRGGWDLVVNMIGIGVFLPLAGWSVARPVQEFPFFYLPSIFLGIGTLYVLTTIADYGIDRRMGVNSLVVRFGRDATINLGFGFLVLDTVSLIIIGYFDYLVPWEVMRFMWPPLVFQWFVYNHYIMRGRPTYLNIIKTIIVLAGIFIGATGAFLMFYSGIFPVPW
jgi:4-hydroxybenzoate polyprenyltransferase